MSSGRILLVVFLAIAGATSLAPAGVRSQTVPQVMTLDDAVAVLAEERSRGETGVSLLNQFVKSDPGTYAQGQLLYGDARAAFDGLIERLKLQLTQDSAPNLSSQFADALNKAVGKSQAFADFTRNAVLAHQPEGTRGSGIPYGFTINPAELIKELTDSGIRIWTEYHSASAARRDAIRSQIDAQRWPPFTRAGDVL